jgi:hypothetical protein
MTTEQIQSLAQMLKSSTCAQYTAPAALLGRCAQPELVELLVVALKEAVGGGNAAHCGGACNRLLTQAVTGLSPEQIDSPVVDRELIRKEVKDAIDDLDLDQKVEDAIDDANIEGRVESAIDDADVESKVENAIDDLDISSKVREVLRNASVTLSL